MMCERKACSLSSSMRNQAGRTSYVRSEVTRMEGLSFVWYEESSRQDIHPYGTKLVERRVCPRPSGTMSRESKACPLSSGMMSREWKACPLPSGKRNQVGRTSSVQYEVTRKKCLSSSIRYKESSRWHFVHPIRSRAKGGLVLVRQVKGIK